MMVRYSALPLTLALILFLRYIDEEEDGINEEIDPSNIVGSRTRGKKIDFRKAATEAGDELEEDEDDDDDFQAPAEHGHDAMEE